MRLACHARGAPDLAILIFSHGYPDTHAVWQPLVGELAGGFHCVRYDARGAGASSHPKRVRPTT